MNDKKLRALLTAVQCGSFGKATAQLGYTQSAMTHMVNRLEAELGCTLLVRGSHGVRLSEEGEKLLPYMQAVIDAGDALRRRRRPRAGCTRIPCGSAALPASPGPGCRSCCASFARSTRRSRWMCWCGVTSWHRS